VTLVEKIHYLKTDSEAKQEVRVLNARMWEDGVGGKKGKIRQGDTKNAEEEEKQKENTRCREKDEGRNFDLTNADNVICPIPTSRK
jgi:hypothetical protein